MKKQFKVKCILTGIEHTFYSIARAKLYYENLKLNGLKPKIYKLNTK